MDDDGKMKCILILYVSLVKFSKFNVGRQLSQYLKCLRYMDGHFHEGFYDFITGHYSILAIWIIEIFYSLGKSKIFKRRLQFPMPIHRNRNIQLKRRLRIFFLEYRFILNKHIGLRLYQNLPLLINQHIIFLAA